MEDKYPPVCPHCNVEMQPVYENNGYTMPEGPEHVEVIGFVCSECGREKIGVAN